MKPILIFRYFHSSLYLTRFVNLNKIEQHQIVEIKHYENGVRLYYYGIAEDLKYDVETLLFKETEKWSNKCYSSFFDRFNEGDRDTILTQLKEADFFGDIKNGSRYYLIIPTNANFVKGKAKEIVDAIITINRYGKEPKFNS